MSRVNKILSSVLLVLFLGTMFLSLFHMSMGMDMAGGMSDCPFMAHEEVVCQMNFADHVGVWKSIFASFVPTLVTLLAVTGVAVLLVSLAPNLLKRFQWPPVPPLSQVNKKLFSFSYRPLQELFSNGILHPKLF